MVIPTIRLDEGNFESDVRLNHLRHLSEAAAERTPRILDPAHGLILGRIRLLQEPDRFEGLRSGAAQNSVDRLFIHTFEAGFDRGALTSRLQLEVIQAAQGKSWSLATQGPGQIRRHCNGAKGGLPRILFALKVTVEPAIGCTLDAGRSRFHEILGVKV